MGEPALSRRAEELSSPDAWILSKFEFDVFGTLTWAEIPPLRVMEKCVMELIRRTAKQVYKVSSPDEFLYAFRFELGEGTGRPHYHFLTGPHHHRPHTNKDTIAYQIAHIWDTQVKETKSKRFKPCVGHCDIRPYDSSESGAEYICKPVLSARDFYEMQKFRDGFERAASDEGTRVCIGSRLLLEIAKRRNKSDNVPGFARLLRTLKQRNVGSKRATHDTKKYTITPDTTLMKHPADPGNLVLPRKIAMKGKSSVSRSQLSRLVHIQRTHGKG